jgi:hypothetical protein
MDKEHEKAFDQLSEELFDPPIRGRVCVAGRPVLEIPASEKKYPDFLTWWREVGRLNPTDPQGWSTLSGPGVMWGRKEIIPESEWLALDESERELIREWTEHFRLGLFYD